MNENRVLINRHRLRVVLSVAVVVAGCSAIALGQDALPGELGVEEFSGAPTSVSGGALEAVMFYVFGGSVLMCAIGVCVTKSVVRMATWLFGTLAAVAVLYFLLGAMFLGAVQLIVYAGGTLILLVFGVMLTSKSPWVRFEARRTEMVAAGCVALALFAGLATVLVKASWPVQVRVARSATIEAIGKELLTTYLVPFEVVSVLLLVVMIAAAYLARQEKQ